MPWERPEFDEDEPGGHWFSGRANRQVLGPIRFNSLQTALASALEMDRDSPQVIRAVAEVAVGITVRTEYLEFTLISERSLAVTDRSGETTFLDLNTGGTA